MFFCAAARACFGLCLHRSSFTGHEAKRDFAIHESGKIRKYAPGQSLPAFITAASVQVQLEVIPGRFRIGNVMGG
jgi:hypothetical protein